METRTCNVYTFEELSPEGQRKAIERYYDINVDHEWWRYTYDDAEDIGLKITEFDLDRLQPGWRDETGEPAAYIHHDTKIRLGCIPENDGTLSLEVNRIPLALMATGTDVPEIAARHHRTLVQWALFRAFSVPDSEVVDPNKAAMAEREFTKMFGLRMDATTRRDHETSLPHSNASIWL